MTEVLDAITKVPWAAVVPWLISLFTIGTTLWVATQQMKAGRLQPFRQKQLDLYIQATEAAGRLASETNEDEWEKARTTFWRLYWGPLCIVEDKDVERRMVELGELVPQEPLSPDTNEEDRSNLRASLKSPSLRLARAARGETELRAMAGFSSQ
jgi:hypothetical protein